MKMLFAPLAIIAMLTCPLGCADSSTAQVSQSSTVYNPDSDMMRGLSFVAPPKKIEAHCFDDVVAVNANWVTLMPYAYGRAGNPGLSWNINWQWWGERTDGTLSCIEMAHAKGLKVMVKPHVWINHGSFTGDLNFGSDEEWKDFEKDYEAYVLEFAKLSEEAGAESYCLGTEWKKFVEQRPEFWSQLIDKVRAVYSGELTYAGNWDSYNRFPHWEKLDYIGIDAYFPLTSDQQPDLKTLKAGWESHLDAIGDHARSVGKQVVFTEYGYRSMDYLGKEPWDSGNGHRVNMQAQVDAYEAFFQTVWHQEWFRGGFAWKWFHDQESSGGTGNNKFTPQNKPAQEVLKKWYGKS